MHATRVPAQLGAPATEPAPAFVERLAAAQRLGPVGRVEMDGQRVVLVTGGDEVRALLVDGSEHFTKHSHRARVLLGNGLISASGAEWKRQRRRLQGYFSGSGLRDNLPHITAAARRAAARWEELADREGETTDVGEDMRFFALDTIWRVLTGRELDGPTALRLSTVDEVVAALPTMGSDPATDTALGERLAGIEAVAREVIAAARHELGAGPDAPRGILHDLLDPALADEFGPYPDDLVRDELVTLVVAGFETTATALTWLHLLLDAHPWARAWALESGPAGSRARSQALQALVSEALRLYPPVWLLPRHAAEDRPLGDHAVPAGSRVLACPYLSQRDPERVPDPDTFDPARFLGPDRPAHDTHFPFGLGPRVCLGRQFSLAEMQALLEAVLPFYAPEFADADRTPVFAATLRPRGPFTAGIHRTATVNR